MDIKLLNQSCYGGSCARQPAIDAYNAWFVILGHGKTASPSYRVSRLAELIRFTQDVNINTGANLLVFDCNAMRKQH